MILRRLRDACGLDAVLEATRQLLDNVAAARLADEVPDYADPLGEACSP